LTLAPYSFSMQISLTHSWRKAVFAMAVTFAVLFMAGTAAHAASPAVTDAAPQSRETLWSLIKKAGVVMYPLGLCSLLALGITIERAISLRRKRNIPEGFL